MGLFGFGKKKNQQQSPVQKQEPTPAPSQTSSVNDISDRLHKYINDIANRAPDNDVAITIPREIDGKQIAYKYDDVQLKAAGVPASQINPSMELTLKENGEKIEAYQGSLFLGTLPENRLSGMVKDWNEDGNPYLAYIAHYSDAGDNVQIYLVFYNNKTERFLSKADAKHMKLTGKPDEFATPHIGDNCEVEYDFEKEKYIVTSLLDGSVYGYLPAAAAKYADACGINPENLQVMVSAVDYDIEKARDIITVCISD